MLRGSWSLRLYVVLIVAYFIVLAFVNLYNQRTPGNLTQFAAVSICVATLFVGLRSRGGIQRLWSKLNWSAPKKLLFAGGLGAVYVETEYEVWQHVFGANGVAASPNLAIDLLVTMPWYLMMVGFLAIALKHRRATLFELLLLGGIYELMADGLLSFIFSGRPLFDYLVLPFMIPIFTLVYAPIVVLPALAVWPSYQKLWSTARSNGSRIWLMLPCLAIVPYGVLLTLLLGRG